MPRRTPSLLLDATFPLALLKRLTSPNADKVIEGFVRGKISENAYLDFKRKSEPQKGELNLDDKRSLSKALSGFAHADSGLIVWGVDARREKNDPEKPDTACDLYPIRNVRAFVSNLTEQSMFATTPPVPGVQHFALLRSRDSGFAVSYVPVGLLPPYRANWCDGKFYKRSATGFHPMEPYDLRDVILRKQYATLRLEALLQLLDGNADTGIAHYQLICKINNVGGRAVKDWKLVLEFSNAIADTTSYPNNWVPRAEQFIRENSQWRRITIQTTVLHSETRPTATVFPEESVEVVGPHSVMRCVIRLALTAETRKHGGKPIVWHLFSDSGPAAHGEVILG